jgi:hypothetical protein
MPSSLQKNYYMINMQKILFVARELHNRGYEKLRVVPSISPNGMAWRCAFTVGEKEIDKINELLAVSPWLETIIKNKEGEINQSVQELTDLLENEIADLLIKCKGKNYEYVKWYSEMLDTLQKEELPYAFDDYFPCTDYWETTLNNKIKLLSDEREYY